MISTALPVNERVLDIELAKKINYHVLPDKGSAAQHFYLIPPYKAFGGGLSSVHGTGPAYRSDKPIKRWMGYSAEEAWEWVPDFISNPEHFIELVMFMKIAYKLEPLRFKAPPIETVSYYLQQLNRYS